MEIRTTEERDWLTLKEIRLAALLDAPMAFGVSYQTAISNSDDQWKQRASTNTQPKFWLAFNNEPSQSSNIYEIPISALNRLTSTQSHEELTVFDTQEKI